jgi:hypothetical protein
VRFAARGSSSARDLRKPLLTPRQKGDRGARSSEAVGGRFTDAARRTRDDDSLAHAA